MTIVVPCSECGGKGHVSTQYGTKECPMCESRGYRTNTEYKPPEVPRKSQGMAPWVQLELPI